MDQWAAFLTAGQDKMSQLHGLAPVGREREKDGDDEPPAEQAVGRFGSAREAVYRKAGRPAGGAPERQRTRVPRRSRRLLHPSRPAPGS